MNTTEIKQETETPRKSRTAKPKRTAVELLNDPSIVTVSVSQAAMILGISKQTAHKTFHESGYLLKGNRIPVLQCGNRTIVSIEHIRAALDYPTHFPPDICICDPDAMNWRCRVRHI